MKKAVKQMRGPGMNLGMKKPRKGYIPKPEDVKSADEKMAKGKPKAAAGKKELPAFLMGKQAGKAPAPKKGGKAPPKSKLF